MDTNTWEHYVPCSRLKTKRRKKRLQKTDADKNLICLFKKLETLAGEIRNLGYEELIPPVQRGWKRFFILKPELERSPDADFLKELLSNINTTQYSHRRDFKTKTKRKGKKVYVERIQNLEELQDYLFQKKIVNDKEKLYFKEEWDFRYCKRNPFKKYVFTHPWKFVLKTEPNMITKTKITDPMLLQKLAEIEDYFNQRNLYTRLNTLTGGHHRYRWGKDEKEKYKSLRKIHIEAMNENKTFTKTEK